MSTVTGTLSMAELDDTTELYEVVDQDIEELEMEAEKGQAGN